MESEVVEFLVITSTNEVITLILDKETAAKANQGIKFYNPLTLLLYNLKNNLSLPLSIQVVTNAQVTIVYALKNNKRIILQMYNFYKALLISICKMICKMMG